ncbi:MAG: response regulator [Phycisphaeraceae bacterium]
MDQNEEIPKQARILIVEDEQLVAQDLRVTLERQRYEITATVPSAEDAFQCVQADRPDLVLMDIQLQGEMDGIQAAEILRANHDLPVIYLTAHGDKHTLERAKVTEPFGYILKPFDEQSLYSNIELALYRHQMEMRIRKSERALRRDRDELEQRVQDRTAVLEQQKRELRTLAAELNQAVQGERRRLAKLLHDQLQQYLVALKYSLGGMRKGADQDLREQIDNAASLAQESMDLSRSLAMDLYPPALYTQGLSAAMEWLTGWMKEKYGLHIQVEADPLSIEDETLRDFLFEAVREMLLNVVKHARADSARVELQQLSQNAVRIAVSDAGIGFDADKLETSSGAASGILTLRHRATLLGGHLSIRSEPGRGARVEIQVPLAVADARSRPPAEPAQNQQAAAPTSSPGEDVIRVMLVDDHKIVRNGVAGILRQEPDLQVIVEVSDGNEALTMARRLKPDVVLMDMEMPGLTGVETTRMLVREKHGIHVIGLSMYKQRSMAIAMRDVGAAAYLTKDESSEDLCRVIRAVHRQLPHEYQLLPHAT